MSETVILQIPEELALSARALAAAANRPLEEALVDWIRSAIEEPPVETLADESLLALSELQWNAAQQAELSDLLAQQREGPLSPADRTRLDVLLGEYRRGMLLKARAWKAAVDRGLRPSLSDHGS